MTCRPQKQALVSLKGQVHKFNCDGGLRSCLDDGGHQLTLVGFFDGRTLYQTPTQRAAARRYSRLREPEPPIAVFGVRADGDTLVVLPAGRYAGAVLLRPARMSERPDSRHPTRQPAVSAVALRPAAIIGFGLVFSELPNPASYMEIV